jgi:DNA-binding NarL/FixJ family response regulator
MTMEDAVRFSEAVAELDIRAILPLVRTPTLVMHTAHDAANPAKRGRKFASSIPDAQYVELPGKNHVLFPRDPGFHLLIKLLLEFIDDTKLTADPLACLSSRERDILDAVCEGLSNEAIAVRRGISVRTVRNHLTKVFEKLGVASRTQAALLAVRLDC